jgi:hypothetical protein
MDRLAGANALATNATCGGQVAAQAQAPACPIAFRNGETVDQEAAPGCGGLDQIVARNRLSFERHDHHHARPVADRPRGVTFARQILGKNTLAGSEAMQ